MWHIETKDDTFNRLYILCGTLKPKMTRIKWTVHIMWHQSGLWAKVYVVLFQAQKKKAPGNCAMAAFSPCRILISSHYHPVS